MSIYKENGYEDRADYLKCLSEDYGVPLGIVVGLARILGEEEDFDMLPMSLDEGEY